MTNTSQTQAFSLRRSYLPYRMSLLILTVVTVFSVYVAQEKRQWGLVWAVVLCWALSIAYIVLFQLRYMIRYDEGGLTMTARGGSPINIPYADITDIRYEVGSTNTFPGRGRPFRRLVVTSGRAPKQEDLIDISLRHFRPEDIQAYCLKLRSVGQIFRGLASASSFTSEAIPITHSVPARLHSLRQRSPAERSMRAPDLDRGSEISWVAEA